MSGGIGILLVFVDDIHSYSSPDSVGNKQSTYYVAYRSVYALEEAGEEQYTDSDVDYHHEDIEANAKSLRLAGLGII